MLSSCREGRRLRRHAYRNSNIYSNGNSRAERYRDYSSESYAYRNSHCQRLLRVVLPK